MARGRLQDPMKVFRFAILWDSQFVAGFNECTGLEMEIDKAEYREGGMNETPQKSAGLSKYSDLTLKKGQYSSSAGITGLNAFIEWVEQVHKNSAGIGNPGNPYRKDLTIIQYGADGQVGRAWTVYNAFPVRYKAMSDMNGTSSDNSIEELVVTYEGFDTAQ